MFLFAGPNQLGIDMWIERIVFFGQNWGIGLLGNKTYGWIINAGFCFVIVLFDGAFRRGLLGFVGGLFLPGTFAYLILSESRDCTVALTTTPRVGPI
jgi:hypothetical protein